LVSSGRDGDEEEEEREEEERGVVLDCPFGEAMVGSWGGCGGMEGSCWSWMSFVMLELGVSGGDVWSRVLPRKDGCHVSRSEKVSRVERLNGLLNWT
jgi:hypothetical protein